MVGSSNAPIRGMTRRTILLVLMGRIMTSSRNLVCKVRVKVVEDRVFTKFELNLCASTVDAAAKRSIGSFSFGT